MGETRDIETYIAKEDIYDSAGYNHPKIPKGAQVKFISEYTCFYGRFIKIAYDGYTYYTKPEMLKKIVVTRRLLTTATSGCSAHHPYYNTVILSAKIVTEGDGEFWIAQDKEGHYHIVNVADCQSLYLIEEQHEEKVTYFG